MPGLALTPPPQDPQAESLKVLAPEPQPQEQQVAPPAAEQPGASSIDNMDFSEEAQQLDAERTQQVQNNPDPMGGHGVGSAFSQGGEMAVMELKDLVFGEPNYEDKSGFRKFLEADQADTRRAGMAQGLAQGVGTFIAGMLGFEAAGGGKLLAGMKGAGKTGVLAAETLRGAAVGSAVFDPQQERISNLVEQFPSLQNPVTAYLAAKDSDTDAEGRFKNALEGIGMDVALAGVFALGAKALKLRQAGKIAEADSTAAQAAADLEKIKPEPAAGELGDLQKQALAGPDGGAPRPAAGELGDKQKAVLAGPDSSPPSPEVTPKIEPQAAKVDPWENVKKIIAEDTGAPGNEKLVSAPVKPEGQVLGEDAKIKNDVPKVKAAPISDETVQKIMDGTQFEIDKVDPTRAVGHHPGSFLNWTKVSGPADVGNYTVKVAQTLKAEFNSKPISDATINRMVSERALAFNEDPVGNFAWLKQQGKNMQNAAADMEASYRVTNAMFQDLYKLAGQIKQGLLGDFGGDLDAAKAEFVKRLAITGQSMNTALEIKAGAGRTLRRMRAEFKMTPEMVDQFRAKPEGLIDAIYQTKGDPKLMQPALNPTTWEKVSKFTSQWGQTLLISGPLWNYPTHIWNSVSNIMMLANKPTSKFIGSLTMDAWDALRGKELLGAPVRRQALKEFRYTAAALRDGWDAAVDAFLQGDGKLAPHSGLVGGEAPFAQGGQVPSLFKVDSLDALAKAALVYAQPKNSITMPLRVLGAADEAMKVIRYRAYVMSETAMMAEDLGLSGAEADAYIAKGLQDAFDMNGKGLHTAALDDARATTFNSPLLQGTLGKSIQDAVSNTPILRAVFTYVRTPVNALRYEVKMTPILNLAQKEFRANLTSDKPLVRAEAHGQMAMGLMWFALAAPVVAQGKITGAGPSDPKLKAELIAQGWKPYSFVMENSDGSKSYIPVNRFGPPGLTLGIMADINDMMQHPELRSSAGNAMTAVFTAVTQNITNRSYLTSLNQAIQAISNPVEGIPKWLGQLGNTMIPFSSGMRSANDDPYLREARTFTDRLMANMPGHSKEVEPRYNALGEPMLVHKGLWATNNATDPVHTELQRIMLETGQGLTPMNPKPSDVDFRDFKLKNGRSAYGQMNEYLQKPPSGPSMTEAIGKLIQTDGYKKAPDGDNTTPGTKLQLINALATKLRDGAYKRVLAENPDFAEAVYNKRRQAAAAYRQSKDAPKPADQVINALGLNKQ